MKCPICNKSDEVVNHGKGLYCLDCGEYLSKNKAAKFDNLVVSAAMLMDDGLIVTGVRHYSPDMRAVLQRIYGDGYHLKVKEQGFVDRMSNFLTREQAWPIAEKAGQIRRRCGGDGEELYSENLY